MAEYEIQEIDITDLLGGMVNNVKKDLKTFDDLVQLDRSVNRNLYLSDITSGLGIEANTYIRFWNDYDDAHNIPIEERQPIKIYIDSCGGELTDTLTIIDSIKNSKTPVYTIAIGCVYSGGFFIFISGHRRYSYPHASFLFHEGATSNSGTSSQFENYTAFYKKLLNQIKVITLENTKITEEEYNDIHKDDIWYTAEEALEKGIIDEIVGDLK